MIPNIFVPVVSVFCTALVIKTDDRCELLYLHGVLTARCHETVTVGGF